MEKTEKQVVSVIYQGENMIHAVIYMEPVGKARARTVRRGNKVISYTPDKTSHAENLIRDKVMEIGKKFEPGIPLCLIAIFYRTRPKSTKKTMELPVTRPDWDNYGKLLTDALEKFLYENDSQIT